MKIINQKWYYHKNGYSHTFCVQREDKKWAVALSGFKSWIGEEVTTEEPWIDSFEKLCHLIEKYATKDNINFKIIRGTGIKKY